MCVYERMNVCMYVRIYMCYVLANPLIPSSPCNHIENLHILFLNRERANPRVPSCNTYVYKYICVHMCMYIRIHIHTQIAEFAHAYLSTRTSTFMHIYALYYIYIYHVRNTCLHTCIYVCRAHATYALTASVYTHVCVSVDPAHRHAYAVCVYHKYNLRFVRTGNAESMCLVWECTGNV